MLRESQRSIGLELPGGKGGRTIVAVLDVYPKSRKLILSELLPSKTQRRMDLSQDEVLVTELRQLAADCAEFRGLGVSGPLSLPVGFLDGPKSEREVGRAADAESRWMHKTWESLRPKPRAFAPYLQRACEVWLRYLTPEKFLSTDALGANAAPLTARLQHLKHVLPEPRFEVHPRASVLRIAKSLTMPKTIPAQYTDLEKGVAAREAFFTHVNKRLPQLFLYDHDLEAMILHLNHFHAFVSALTVHLAALELTEKPPRGFPKTSAWIHVPRTDTDWNAIF